MPEQAAHRFIPGEDRRIGRPREMRAAHYAFRVALQEIDQLTCGALIALAALQIGNPRSFSDDAWQLSPR